MSEDFTPVCEKRYETALTQIGEKFKAINKRIDKLEERQDASLTAQVNAGDRFQRLEAELNATKKRALEHATWADKFRKKSKEANKRAEEVTKERNYWREKYEQSYQDQQKALLTMQCERNEARYDRDQWKAKYILATRGDEPSDEDIDWAKTILTKYGKDKVDEK